MSARIDLSGALPHRYPMLLVDDIVETVPGERLVARKAVTCNEPWYARLGAAASRSSYPESLVLESWAQAAAVLGQLTLGGADRKPDGVTVLGSVSGVRFAQPVLPGEVLEHHVRLDRVLADTLLFSGRSVVGDTEVLTVSRVVAAWRPAERLRPSAAGRDRVRTEGADQ
ncbi:3-hydroxyacyl-ACP dehydratase FabZ family protein [Amycolatopsis sp. CA-230715]|uniref:3-hydroxyacyl-ACP dehydratase FabZ family protein n=1 Tax=Amycolatopsis sp. CA-230715 TaxID=2745196 RepID=UPI001C323F2B|nr:3-hydroxyacyl-ACP dehydratase FabZ family protein [Amycolatopsis sp. CA-230715]QWF84498.1 hypothetical protein HUW46_07948 [Amycolatopsis sp. CA-230715]